MSAPSPTGFCLTHPVPTINSVPDLIPAHHFNLELDLLKNPLQLTKWLAYLTTLSAELHTSHLSVRGDSLDVISPGEASYLGGEGKLSSRAGQVGLRRIVDAYERALNLFPTYYPLWSTYLSLRSEYVLGTAGKTLQLNKPRSKYATERNMNDFLRAGKDDQVKEIEDGERDVESEWKEGEAVGGVLGFEEWKSLVAVHERALMVFPRFPRIWLSLLTIFTHPDCPAPLSHSHARKTFDRALRSLPTSLHGRIWRVYSPWAAKKGGEMGAKIWRRYLLVDPTPTAYYISLLLSPPFLAPSSSSSSSSSKTIIQPRPLEAAKLLLNLSIRAREGTYVSPEGKSSYQLLVEWMTVCEEHCDSVGLDLESSEKAREAREKKNAAAAPAAGSGEKKKDQAEQVGGGAGKGKQVVVVSKEEIVDKNDPALNSLDPTLLDVAHLLQIHGLNHFPDQAGPLYTALATYWIKRTEFQKAREVFEEAFAKVVTLRDFAIAFDAGVEFEESVISSLMDQLADTAPEEDEEEDEEEVEERKEIEKELDERMIYFEALMDKRPFLVNDVLLRRNPNDVQEWEKRVVLYGADADKIVETYTTALQTIAPRKATVGFHSLWIHFAKFYESTTSLVNARKVFEKAVQVQFRKVEELAEIWCEWAEMEVRNENYDEAIKVMQRATAVPQKTKVNFFDESISPQARLFKSLKLWSFYVDLEESIGTTASTKAVYEQMMELKVANAQIIVNFAEFLEEGGYFEESFKVYERGVALFAYPIAFEIWNTYLSKFIKRYAGDKIERARDLFEQALENCPPKFCKALYLMYGQLEEEHGLAKRAMNVYDRATRAVEAVDRLEMFTYYIAKATANFGLPATRPIYERAIESLPDRQTAEMCLRFAALERELGEIDRARAIFAHASQFCDPRSNAQFWSTWNSFEIETGSEDTFREYLRIKRAVQSAFNTESSYLAAKAVTAAAGEVIPGEEDQQGGEGAGDAMALLEKTGGMGGFVRAKEGGLKGADGGAAEKEIVQGNTDEINMDDDDDDE